MLASQKAPRIEVFTRQPTAAGCSGSTAPASTQRCPPRRLARRRPGVPGRLRAACNGRSAAGRALDALTTTGALPRPRRLGYSVTSNGGARALARLRPHDRRPLPACRAPRVNAHVRHRGDGPTPSVTLPPAPRRPADERHRHLALHVAPVLDLQERIEPRGLRRVERRPRRHRLAVLPPPPRSPAASPSAPPPPPLLLGLALRLAPLSATTFASARAPPPSRPAGLRAPPPWRPAARHCVAAGLAAAACAGGRVVTPAAAGERDRASARNVIRRAIFIAIEALLRDPGVPASPPDMARRGPLLAH